MWRGILPAGDGGGCWRRGAGASSAAEDPSEAELGRGRRCRRGRWRGLGRIVSSLPATRRRVGEVTSPSGGQPIHVGEMMWRCDFVC
jgi:hypothetical protein